MITNRMRVILGIPSHLGIVSAYLDSLERHDVASLKRLMSRDATLIHANYPPVRGRDEAVDMIEGYLEIIDGLEFDVRTVLGDQGYIVIEKINIAGAPNVGLAHIRVVTILEIGGDDLIASVRIYADSADLFRKLELSRLSAAG